MLDLAGLPKKRDLEGRSLRPLLKSPNAGWGRPILSTFCPNNHSLRSTDFHYIRYSDGSEELYDMRTDPHEWRNLAADKRFAQTIANLRKRLPKKNQPPIRSDWHGWEIQAWEEAERNSASN